MEARAIDVKLLGEDAFFRVFGEDTMFFNLWRENIVAQSISLFRAVATQHFHSKDETRPPPPPAYDAGEIRRWLQHLMITETDNWNMLERAGRHAKALCYEEMVRDKVGTIRAFADALNVTIEFDHLAGPIEGETRKIGDAWNSQVEERFRNEQSKFVAEIEAMRQDRMATFTGPTATWQAARRVRTCPPGGLVTLPDHRGKFYQDCLRDLHRVMAPNTYLEIGTLHGDTLCLASCRSIAVDPQLRLSKQVVGTKPALHMFQTTSDAFFATHDPIALLGDRIDLAFLDGMHLYEFLLRDFIETERACHSGSIVVLHDCLPLDSFMATRDPDDRKVRAHSRHPLWWTGDVWKLIPILRHYRGHLTITLFDAPPTGLALITGLDANDRTLRQHYAEIVAPKPDSPWHDDNIGQYLSNVVLRSTSHLLDHIKSHKYRYDTGVAPIRESAADNLSGRTLKSARPPSCPVAASPKISKY
jgi:hypothetical protein